MKISKLILLFLAVFCIGNLQAQAPQSINYQAVVRDATGAVVGNKAVTFRLSILTGTSTGAFEFIEVHNVTTNAFGLVTLGIGLGTPRTGSMSTVSWATGSKFLRVEVDIAGGTNFTVLGTTQFLSVPYALYAATSGNSAASGWGLTGNATTAANFIGTTNADDLRFNTEGSQKMVLKANGNVGVGTNIPDFKMSIENAANSTAGIDDGSTLLQLHNKSVANFATTNLRVKTGNSQYLTMLAHYGPTYTQYPGFADYGLVASTGPGLMLQALTGNIRFMTGASSSNVPINDRMIITNEGNVGIGTTTPDVKLSIEGDGDGSGTFDDRFLMKINNKSTSSASQAILQIKSGSGSNYFNISQSAPNYTVSEKADASILYATGRGGLVLQASPKSSSDPDLSAIHFYTGWTNVSGGSTERMTLDKTGNLGIGTNSPTNKLHIEANESGEGSTDGRMFMRFKNTSTGYASNVGQILQAGNSGTFTIMNHHSSTYTVTPNADDMGQIWSSGKGLILRASPATAAQDFQGSIRFYTGWNSSSALASNERMRVEANGNVGIGTTTPKAKLEVTNGDVYVNDATKGIILKAPNGGCWRVTVDNTGNFVRTSITCPN